MHKEGRNETPKLFACRIPVQNEERKMIIGYARVSTDGQTLDAQQAALAAAGAEKVFAERVSGAVTDRKAPAKAILALGPGDVQFNYYLKVNEPRFRGRSGHFYWSFVET
jgi:hypothetical protein